MYEITVDLLNGGLLPGLISALLDEVGTTEPEALTVVTAPSPVGPRQSTRLRRSALNSQPYNEYSPRMFLQLGEVQAHSNTIEATKTT